MAETSSNYKRLGRNGTTHHGLRSFSTFFLLLAAVVLFSLLYLYFSVSNELQSFRTDYEDLNSQQLKLKNELLDANLKMEALKKSGSECSANSGAIKAKHEACQKDLDEKRASLSRLEGHKNDCDGTVKELKQTLETTRKNLEEENGKNQNHEKTIKNLTMAMEQLKNELRMVKSGAPAGNNGALSALPSAAPIVGNVLDQPKGSGTTPKNGEHVDTAAAAPLIDDGKAAAADAVDDAAHEKQSDGGGGVDFIAPKRSAGGRVHLEEQAARREQFASHKELLRAAAKMDKQREEEQEDGNGEEEAEENENKKEEGDAAKENDGPDADKTREEAKKEQQAAKNGQQVTTKTTTPEKNRPLVDALHGIVA